MTTQKQIATNRRNAVKSTGPKSNAGKTASKFNATTHGLSAERVVIRGEDPEEFDELRRQLVAELGPTGRQETDLVDRIAICSWRLRRLYAVEAGIFDHERAKAEREAAEAELSDHEESLFEALELSGPKPGHEKEFEKASNKIENAERILSETSISVGAAFIRDSDGANALSKLSRYETTIERSLGRARDELARIQAERKNGGSAPVTTIDLVPDEVDVEP